MTANEWLELMKKASDFPDGMERLIVKYGEMLIKEYDSKVKKLNEPTVSKCEGIEREALLLKMQNWLMVNTSLEVEKIVDFTEHFKQ